MTRSKDTSSKRLQTRPKASKLPKVDMSAKVVPQQERAVATVERILECAVQLLADVGVERLSTNLICERAGLTPPALYRYFPNKYAVLRELGARLMSTQNELIEAWATPQNMALPAEQFAQSVLQLFAHTVQLTEAQPAGIWITRALRAVPVLSDVRIQSHRYVAGLIEQAVLAAYPDADPGSAKVFSRLSVETGYAAQEMLFDDPTLDGEAVALHVANMLAGEAVRLRPQAGARAHRGSSATQDRRKTAHAVHNQRPPSPKPERRPSKRKLK
jgi:AcrR family transcriptional regulator